MKTGTVTLGNASIHIGYSGIIKANKRGLLRELSEFNVPEERRGKGEGTALLTDLCEQADLEGLVLMITADTPRLGYFYARHGFVTVQDEGAIIMARMPISTKGEANG